MTIVIVAFANEEVMNLYIQLTHKNKFSLEMSHFVNTGINTHQRFS